MKYAKLTTMLMVLIVVSMPLNASLGMASSKVLTAEEACIEKHKEESDVSEFLDNDVINALEAIASILFFITTVMNSFEQIMDNIMSIIGAGKECCALPPPVCVKNEEDYRWWEKAHSIFQVLDCFVNCGWCNGGCSGLGGIPLDKFTLGAIPSVIEPDPNMILEPNKIIPPNTKLGVVSQSSGGIGQFHISPYDNIYVAAGCLCPVAILYNLRKLKTIYDSYNCCIEQSCKAGLSIDECDHFLSTSTCMYWEGSIYKMLVNVALSFISKWLGDLIPNALLDPKTPLGQFTNCALLIFRLVQIPDMIDQMKDAWNWMTVTFDKPNCKQLGYDHIKPTAKQMHEANEDVIEDLKERPDYSKPNMDPKLKIEGEGNIGYFIKGTTEEDLLKQGIKKDSIIEVKEGYFIKTANRAEQEDYIKANFPEAVKYDGKKLFGFITSLTPSELELFLDKTPLDTFDSAITAGMSADRETFMKMMVGGEAEGGKTKGEVVAAYLKKKEESKEQLGGTSFKVADYMTSIQQGIPYSEVGKYTEQEQTRTDYQSLTRQRESMQTILDAQGTLETQKLERQRLEGEIKRINDEIKGIVPSQASTTPTESARLQSLRSDLAAKTQQLTTLEASSRRFETISSSYPANPTSDNIEYWMASLPPNVNGLEAYQHLSTAQQNSYMGYLMEQIRGIQENPILARFKIDDTKLQSSIASPITPYTIRKYISGSNGQIDQNRVNELMAAIERSAFDATSKAIMRQQLAAAQTDQYSSIPPPEDSPERVQQLKDGLQTLQDQITAAQIAANTPQPGRLTAEQQAELSRLNQNLRNRLKEQTDADLKIAELNAQIEQTKKSGEISGEVTTERISEIESKISQLVKNLPTGTTDLNPLTGEISYSGENELSIGGQRAYPGQYVEWKDPDTDETFVLRVTDKGQLYDSYNNELTAIDNSGSVVEADGSDTIMGVSVERAARYGADISGGEIGSASNPYGMQRYDPIEGVRFDNKLKKIYIDDDLVPSGAYVSINGKVYRVTDDYKLYDAQEDTFFEFSEGDKLREASADTIMGESADEAPMGMELSEFYLNRLNLAELRQQYESFFGGLDESDPLKKKWEKLKDNIVANREELEGIVKERQEKFIEEKAKAYVIKKVQYELVYQLLKLTLGKFAYDAIDEKCEDDWEASESETDSSINVNAGSDLKDFRKDFNAGEVCKKTNGISFNAQCIRKFIDGKYRYTYSFGLVSCSTPIDYDVSLRKGDNEMIILSSKLKAKEAYSYINTGNELTEGIDYSNICIRTYANESTQEGCFPVKVKN